MSRPCVWDDLIGQRKAVSFLRAAVDSEAVGHAYLLVGPTGAGKKTTAKAMACALLCDDGGCGACRICYRIKRGVHPDVRIIRPEGAASYLLREQIRPLIAEIQLKPLEAPFKIYIIESADMMRDDSANAFLKTLEEPPGDVVFFLLAPSFDSVLPTIASRCQVVRFARIPPSTAQDLLVERSGAHRDEAAAALAATAGVMARALEFLESPSRRDARLRTLRTLKDLAVMDEQDVLVAARGLLASVKAPLEELKAAQADEIREREEFLGAGVGKALKDRHKRELTAREREGIAEVLNVAESWLRDCLVLSQGVSDLVSNADARDAMEEVAAVITPSAATRALDAVTEARRRVAYNVSPQLALEVLLFDIQEVLQCPR